MKGMYHEMNSKPEDFISLSWIKSSTDAYDSTRNPFLPTHKPTFYPSKKASHAHTWETWPRALSRSIWRLSAFTDASSFCLRNKSLSASTCCSCTAKTKSQKGASWPRSSSINLQHVGTVMKAHNDAHRDFPVKYESMNKIWKFAVLIVKEYH